MQTTMTLTKQEILLAVAEYVRQRGYRVPEEAEVVFHIRPGVDAMDHPTDVYDMDATVDIDHDV